MSTEKYLTVLGLTSWIECDLHSNETTHAPFTILGETESGNFTGGLRPSEKDR